MNFTGFCQGPGCPSPALLLSPAELAFELAAAPNAGAVARHALHIEAADDESADITTARRPQASRFALLVHGSGLRVALLVVQSAGVQLRFLVPIIGARQRAWIQECVQEGDVLLSLEAQAKKQFVLVNVPLTLGPDGPRLLRHCEPAARLPRHRLASVLATLVGALQSPHRVMTLVPGMSVARAQVFVALPAIEDARQGFGPLPPRSLH